MANGGFSSEWVALADQILAVMMGISFPMARSLAEDTPLQVRRRARDKPVSLLSRHVFLEPTTDLCENASSARVL